MKRFLERYIYNQDLTLQGLDAKRITILNFCCLMMGLDIVFFTIKRFFEKTLTSEIAYFYTAFLTLFVIVYTLQKARCYITARVLFLCSYIIAVVGLTHILFEYENTEYNYLALPILALFFFDKKWVHYMTLLISVGLFFIPYYVTQKRNIENFVPEEKIFLFVILFLVVNFFKNLNDSNEKKLKKAYVELEEKRKNEFAHLQLKSLKAQMNPHFMFNAMNSIQNLVLKGDKHKAYDYLTKFAALIRENLNMSEKSFIFFDEELLLLEKYLELEKLRFRTNFEYSINGGENLFNIKIPSMIIQPFVENAIKHGLLHKKEGVKKIILKFELKEVLHCTIIDNGVGISESERIKQRNGIKSTSLSTKLIEERLMLLKDYYKSNIGFNYEKVKEGTKVIIKIPFIIENE
ncbi:sensor histidine kinase [uncultured Tenacibaculum sp.]|uniref:sensor histidine kinase n=1 Tax=uncultured Tenacibaculum sp. TaxID=174713 RepID=UPI00261B7B0D|nr:histidine kinase [uncultured Tenacibaculum sp.]